MASTFVDLASDRAIRIVAPDGSRELARLLFPHLEIESRQQMQAYRELAVDALFREQWVRVSLDPAEPPGYKSARVICPRRGESVNFGGFAEADGERLCLSCACPKLRYWEPEKGEQ